MNETVERIILGVSARQRFLNRVLGVAAGADVLWTPNIGDGLVVQDAASNKITWINAPVITALGRGYSQSFNGTSDRGVMLDQARHSYGDGTADQAVSWVVLANVTDTAAARIMVSKFDNAAAAAEWGFQVGSTDLLQVQLFDQSAAVSVTRTSNSAITMGSWRLFAGTYTGAGGATAADGVLLYQDAAAIASTAANNASYVAMENLTTGVNIGARGGIGSFFFAGSLAFILVRRGVFSVPQLVNIKSEVNSFYQLSL